MSSTHGGEQTNGTIEENILKVAKQQAAAEILTSKLDNASPVQTFLPGFGQKSEETKYF